MNSSIATVMLMVTATYLLISTAECRITKPHWSFNNFPGPEFKRKASFPSYGSRPFSNSIPKSSLEIFKSQIPSSSYSHSPVSSYRSQMSAEKQQYLMSLVAKLWRHKQAENAYSTQLLNSFGSNVAPGHRKK